MEEDQEQRRLHGKFKNTVQFLLRRCSKVAGTKYVKLYENALKVITVLWGVKKGILLEGTKWWIEQ